jgi:hypothetical protein
VEFLRTRLFLQAPGESIQPSDLQVSSPTPFRGELPKTIPAGAVLFECSASFPGVLPEGGFKRSSYSNLEALLGVLSSTEEFCKRYQKSGGKIYRAMANDENVPDASGPIRLKDFFSL